MLPIHYLEIDRARVVHGYARCAAELSAGAGPDPATVSGQNDHVHAARRRVRRSEDNRDDDAAREARRAAWHVGSRLRVTQSPGRAKGRSTVASVLRKPVVVPGMMLQPASLRRAATSVRIRTAPQATLVARRPCAPGCALTARNCRSPGVMAPRSLRERATLCRTRAGRQEK